MPRAGGRGESMHRICYMSRAALSGEVDLDGILTVSRLRNGTDGITGLLLADGTRYLQALEGEADAVRACYARIAQDDRHCDIVTVADEAIAQRQFGTWSMDYRDPGLVSRDDYKAQTSLNVAGVTDMWLRAMFVGFAVLSR
ncbi:BLUF domain-containing protein [Sphingomonas sp. Leaf343]|uniref:BLUF domain-containing protein n=1 Tax=Sphingomonas sp. Leaf343 TaxID=1736345 RepID=UPI0007152A7C|nr:BLUF domain-containing protein [Sphingomonas sp. Leaf343]KQR87969.1 hypothetical protein ASG07_03705 [Sphingomonas sp. Leaf343]